MTKPDGFSRAALDETLAWLDSPEAEERLEADPYWPKWDGPWWRMTLLHELGLAREIPPRAVRAMVRAVGRYVPHFPFKVEDVPPGKDPFRDIACHCALGTIYQVLAAAGVAVDRELPWIRPWFVRYQLEDGGLNCDEEAYVRPVRRSSVVSTLPPLEAVLLAAPRPLSPEEVRFLDRGAAYLIERRLLRSVSKGGQVIDARWTLPCFPRFYDYDVLRGLAFLVGWARDLGRDLPDEAVTEAVSGLEARVHGGALAVGRRPWEGARTRFQDAAGAWQSGAAARTFRLLDEVGVPGERSPALTRRWIEARDGLDGLRRRGRPGGL